MSDTDGVKGRLEYHGGSGSRREEVGVPEAPRGTCVVQVGTTLREYRRREWKRTETRHSRMVSRDDVGDDGRRP